MRAEIVIEGGQARLTKPVYLKPDAPNHISIEIDDNHVAPTRDWMPEEMKAVHAEPASRKPTCPSARPGSLQEAFNELLGELARERPAASIGDDYQLLTEAMDERYHGR